MICAHRFIRCKFRDGTSRQGIVSPPGAAVTYDEHGVAILDADLVSIRCDDCPHQFSLGPATGEPSARRWSRKDIPALMPTLAPVVPLAPRVTTERVEAALADLGAEHEPAAGWEERVVEGTWNEDGGES